MENKQKKRMVFGRSLIFIILFIAWVGNAILRLVFGYLTASGVQLLEFPVAQSTLNVLAVIFLFLGISGLIASFGLWKMKRWGFLGTIMVIFVTIIFDLWGMTIQYTAVMGFVVPVLGLAYIAVNRQVFVQTISLSSDASMTTLD
jgi:uncharacterized membrane protein (DUF2068 family)